MSEPITCPECGSSVTPRKIGEYEESIRLRCQSCGAVFEYIPGFGSFSASGNERSASYGGGLGARTGDMGYGYESVPELPTGGAGAAIAITCCVLLAFILPLFYVFFLLIP